MNAKTITESLVRLARLGVVVEIRKATKGLNGLEVVVDGIRLFIPLSEIDSEPSGRALARLLETSARHFEDVAVEQAEAGAE